MIITTLHIKIPAIYLSYPYTARHSVADYDMSPWPKTGGGFSQPQRILVKADHMPKKEPKIHDIFENTIQLLKEQISNSLNKSLIANPIPHPMSTAVGSKTTNSPCKPN